MLKNALALFIITVVIVIWFLPSYTKMQELRQKNLELSQRITYLEIKHKKLLEEGRFLRENPEYLEKFAREKMGLIRQGETVYKIVPEQQKKQ